MAGMHQAVHGCDKEDVGGDTTLKRTILIWLLLLTTLLSQAVDAQKLPFLSLTPEEQKEAIRVTKTAVRWWLERRYSDLYSLFSPATGEFEGLSEAESKRRFTRRCIMWRERNPYNAGLSAKEAIERLRAVDVSLRFLTGFVMLSMKPSYFQDLLKARWPRDRKLAFVEYYIRGKRYIQPLLREGKEWKILSQPLELNEQMIKDLEGDQEDGGAKTR